MGPPAVSSRRLAAGAFGAQGANWPADSLKAVPTLTADRAPVPTKRISRQSLDELTSLAAQLRDAASMAGRLVEHARLTEVPAPSEELAPPWQKEGRFRHLVEYVEDVLFEQDANGRWIFLNPAWTTVTGYAVEESLGRSYTEFLHPDDATASRSRFEGLLETGTHDGVHASRYATSGGTWCWLEARVRRHVGPDGKLLGTIGTLRDVTAQREMADELVRAHDQALRSSALMSDFLATMSHEIRTPLNGVIGLTTILLDTSLTDDQREIAASAQRSADALLSLVNDILDISKIEADKVTIELMPFDLRRWANDVTGPSFARARGKGLDVRLVVDSGLPAEVTGDPTRCRQILANFLDNAVKFTESGRVSVHIAPLTTPNGRTMVRVAVTDSGIGIPPEQRANVFEKYRQAEQSTTRRFGGTGLGLAICRQLALRMEGCVGLESEVGKGSTFWYTVPLVAPGPGQPVEAAPPAPEESTAPPALPVLLVEDNPTNQFVARRMLEKAGCHVEVVANGAEALERLKNRTFAIVFMDCQMPVMDGYEATRRIRQMSGPVAAVPIIAMTANAMAGDRERCLEAGMSDYVSKPLKPALLHEALHRAVAGAGAGTK